MWTRECHLSSVAGSRSTVDLLLVLAGIMRGGFCYRLVNISWILLVIVRFGVSYDTEGSCGVSRKNRTHGRSNGRILNGRVSATWPWQVLILKNGIQSCGGTLISNDWIMTAAHCIGKNVRDLTFYVGTHYVSGYGGHIVRAHLYICHPDSVLDDPETYKNDSKTYEHDICLIKLTKIVDFKHVVPVCLPTSGTTIRMGKKVFVTGWGYTEAGAYLPSNRLRQAEVFVLNRTECSGWYQENPGYGRPIPEGHFCAGTPDGEFDTCTGDSGGPLIHKERKSGKTAYVLKGMTSFGVGCGRAKSPGVYVNITYYMNWIDQIMEQASGDSCRASERASECGGNVNESRLIRSPSVLPSYAYPSNNTCSWTIQAPAGFWIKFKFTCYFLLSPERNITDCGDFVTIDSAAGRRKFCGNQLPDPYLVETSSATFTFSSNGNLEYPGFVLDVEFINKTTSAQNKNGYDLTLLLFLLLLLLVL